MNLPWLKAHASGPCLACQPRSMPYSLVQASFWCPVCQRPWRFLYMNPAVRIERATRLWKYLDDAKPHWQRAPA
jgi:hypothetical protein